MRMHGWKKWQTYRRDRGNPPWIKVYRALLRDPAFHGLTDGQAGQLVKLWLLAADHDGTVPDDVQFVERVCGMSSPLELDALRAAGFIDTGDAPADVADDATPDAADDAAGDAAGDAVVDGMPTSPPPADWGEAPGNRGPTRKQVRFLADLAEELGEEPPQPRTSAEASRLINLARAEVGRRRAESVSAAEERGRLDGRVIGRRQQGADAGRTFLDRVRKDDGDDDGE